MGFVAGLPSNTATTSGRQALPGDRRLVDVMGRWQRVALCEDQHHWEVCLACHLPITGQSVGQSSLSHGRDAEPCVRATICRQRERERDTRTVEMTETYHPLACALVFFQSPSVRSW